MTTSTVEAPPEDGTRVTAKHYLKVMDHTGDTRVEWDPAVDEEVEAAEKLFNAMKAKGYLAYELDTDGLKAEVVHEFDPNAGGLVMSPQLVGG